MLYDIAVLREVMDRMHRSVTAPCTTWTAIVDYPTGPSFHFINVDAESVAGVRSNDVRASENGAFDE